jgi:plasmid stabilization system protein ParE
MKFTVTWSSDAENALAALWLDSKKRAAVTRATAVIERILRLNPESLGEERAEGRRWGFVDPLGIDFRVNLDDRLVRVLTVWLVDE